jgi:transposase
MNPWNPTIPTVDSENAATIFVSIELSKKNWLVGIHTPLADKVGLHKVEAGDSVGLLALIRRITKKVERTMSGPVMVIVVRQG